MHVGIIGGLGPLASADFYRRLVIACDASSDQDHPEVTLVSSPQVPSRLAYLERPRSHPDPVPQLVAVARRLVSDGCDVLAMPSITTHAFYDQVQRSVEVPILNMVDSVVGGVRETSCTSVGVLMTTPARERGLLQRALSAAGVAVSLPSESLQRRTQSIVEDVKGGASLRAAGAELRPVVAELGARMPAGSQVLIGCTDISPVALGLDVLDVSQLYADAVAKGAMSVV